MEFDDPSSTTGETSMSSAQTTGPAHFDDDDYPAYTMGEAADEREAADAEESVLAALDELRGFVESHGGTIALESIRDGVVTVRMLGSCDGCPSSNVTLTTGVEKAIRDHWPNFRRLEVLDPDADADAKPADGAGNGHGHSHGASAEQPVQLLQIRGHELQ
jgi:Fe-S cluster biogenesis protein NfuA